MYFLCFFACLFLSPSLGPSIYACHFGQQQVISSHVCVHMYIETKRILYIHLSVSVIYIFMLSRSTLKCKSMCIHVSYLDSTMNEDMCIMYTQSHISAKIGLLVSIHYIRIALPFSLQMSQVKFPKNQNRCHRLPKNIQKQHSVNIIAGSSLFLRMCFTNMCCCMGTYQARRHQYLSDPTVCLQWLLIIWLSVRAYELSMYS